METNVLRPKDAIVANIIESYLLAEAHKLVELNSIPNGRVDASLVLDGELERLSGLTGRFEALPPGVFYPLSTTIGKFRSRKYLRCVGIKFYPHVLSLPAFDYVSLSEPFSFDEIFKPSCNKQLIRNLRRAPDHSEVIRILDAYFIEQLFTNFSPDNWILDVTRAIESESSAQLKIVKVAEGMGMHIKTLERRFQKTIGLSPKSFSAIIRLQQAMKNIQKNRTTISHGDLMDALEHGYYDQSHFIKSCMQITGLTPKRVLMGLPRNVTDIFQISFSKK